LKFGETVVGTLRQTADSVIQDLTQLGDIGKSIYGLLQTGTHAGLDQLSAIQTQLDSFLKTLPDKLLSLSSDRIVLRNPERDRGSSWLGSVAPVGYQFQSVGGPNAPATNILYNNDLIATVQGAASLTSNNLIYV
jgi:hypothetical protein